MKQFIQKFVKDEQGVTALETAIILIAFVVVAAVFAFTILSTGTFLTERSKEAAYAGLAEVRGSMELRGAVVGVAKADLSEIDTVKFTLANVAGGAPINLADGTVAGCNSVLPVVQITYRDSTQEYPLTIATGAGDNLWGVTFLGNNNGDCILDPGELAEISADISGLGTDGTALATNTTFTIEVKPPKGAVLSIQRTTGDRLDAINDLN